MVRLEGVRQVGAGVDGVGHAVLVGVGRVLRRPAHEHARQPKVGAADEQVHVAVAFYVDRRDAGGEGVLGGPGEGPRPVEEAAGGVLAQQPHGAAALDDHEV